MSITHVSGQKAFCKACGELGDVYETPINGDGPFCASCIENESDQEQTDNSAFGLGA